MEKENKIVINSNTQDELTLAIKYCKSLGIRVGVAWGYNCYTINKKRKELRIGTYKDYLECKDKELKGYVFYQASDFFKDELKHINDNFCCETFRLTVQVKEKIKEFGKKYQVMSCREVKEFEITFCPFCGKKLNKK